MSVQEQSGRVRHPRVLIAAGLLLVAAAAVFGVALHAQQHAPQPPPSVAGAATGSTLPAATTTPASEPADTAPRTAAPEKGPILAASKPTGLSLPSIGVHSSLLSLGRNPDNTVQVPPQARKATAGWFDGSPAPGQLGPAILLGHVDSAKYGPGVFFKLGALEPGATVNITRADHQVAVFRIDRVVSYPKDHFPTFDVYGNTDHAALRLITCGGKFNTTAHSYESNIVAYASLVSSHDA